MLYKSALVSQASGSLGGITAANNRGGDYLRRRSKPVNPRTPLQLDVRNILGNLAGAWSQVLTQAQRDAWTLFGKSVPKVNRIGDARQQTGISQYVAANTPRVQAGLDVVSDGPTIFTLPAAPVISLTQTGTGPTRGVTINLNNGDSYDTTEQLLVYEGRPQSAGRSFFLGPYRYAGKADDDTRAVTLLYDAAPYPIAVGQRIFFYARVTLADGRLSPPTRFQLDATATGTLAAVEAAPAATAAAPKELRARARKR